MSDNTKKDYPSKKPKNDKLDGKDEKYRGKDKKKHYKKQDIKNIYGFKNLDYSNELNFSTNYMQWKKDMPNALTSLTLSWEQYYRGDLSQEPELPALSMEEPIRPSFDDYVNVANPELEYEMDKDLYTSAKARYEELVLLRNTEAAKYYQIITNCQTESSRNRCKREPDFAEAAKDQDPIKLLKIIRRTHLSANEQEGDDKDNLYARFFNFKLLTHSIDDYNKLFNDMLETTKIVCGDNKFTEDEIVSRYISSLGDRFSELRKNYKNKVMAKPTTLLQAQTQAVKFKPKGDKFPNTNSIASGYAVDVIDDSVVDNTKANQGKGKNKGQKKLPKYDCPYCLEVFGEHNKHWANQCPRIKEAGERARNHNFDSSSNSKNTSSIHSVSSSGNTTAVITGQSSNKSLAPILAVGFAITCMAVESLSSNVKFDSRPSKHFEILDPQSQVSIFNDRNKVLNIRNTGDTLELFGMGNGSLTCNLRADHPIIEDGVWFNEKARINIWGMRQVEKFCDTWMVKGKDDEGIPYTSAYVVRHRKTGLEFRFIEWNGLYVLGTSMESYVTSSVYRDRMLTSVRERLTTLRKDEQDRVHQVRSWIRTMGFPSLTNLRNGIVKGCMVNLPFTITDIDNYSFVFEKEEAELRGKTTWKRSKNVQVVPQEVDIIKRVREHTLTLYGDLMFYGDNEHPFLITVTSPLNILQVADCYSKTTGEIVNAMAAHIKLLDESGFKMQLYHFDNEKAAASGLTRDYLLTCGVLIFLVDPGTHTEKVERWNRTIKERSRAIQHSLRFQIRHRILRKRLVFWAVRMINTLPNSDQILGITPRELLTGLKADYKLLSKVYFGAYAHIYNNTSKSNTTSSRTHRAICVGYSNGYKCSPIWFNIDTQREVVSSNYTILPIPDEVINLLNNMQEEYIFQSDYDYFDAPQNTSEKEEDDDSDLFEDSDDDENNSIPELIDNDDDEDLDDEKDNSNLGTDNIETAPTESNTAHNESRRVTRSQTRASSNLVEIVQRYGYNISYFRGMSTRPEATDQAARAEIKQLTDLDVGEAQYINSLSQAEINSILNTFMFLKDKFDSKGNFTKYKGRLVVDGSAQDKKVLEEIYGSVYSPTAHMTSILIVLAIAAARRMIMSTLDVAGAFLRSHMDTPTFIKLSPQFAKMWIEFRPQDKDKLTTKKELIIKLKKSLYGCSQSPLLWSKNVEDFLTSLGFRQISKDKSVYCKWDNDKLTIIVTYVDDFLIVSDSEELREKYAKETQSFYGEITQCVGNELEYVGMNILRKESGDIVISMFGFIDSILKLVPPTRKHSTPAGTKLFTLQGGEALNESERKVFHSAVYMLLYLAKRARPDILLPTQFLTSRVSCPNTDDKNKLYRISGYLDATRDLVLTIKGSTSYDIIAYVDASHAVYDDYKSHTGSIITMGNKAIVHFKTNKQKINTKASTESEFVGVSDSLPQIIFVKEFIEEILNQNIKVELLQDNTSTISLIKAGRPLSESTRHINIRFFYIHDYISKGIITVSHCRTENMMADGFTKPLQGAKFVQFRNFLLGIDN